MGKPTLAVSAVFCVLWGLTLTGCGREITLERLGYSSNITSSDPAPLVEAAPSPSPSPAPSVEPTPEPSATPLPSPSPDPVEPPQGPRTVTFNGINPTTYALEGTSARWQSVSSMNTPVHAYWKTWGPDYDAVQADAMVTAPVADSIQIRYSLERNIRLEMSLFHTTLAQTGSTSIFADTVWSTEKNPTTFTLDGQSHPILWGFGPVCGTLTDQTVTQGVYYSACDPSLDPAIRAAGTGILKTLTFVFEGGDSGITRNHVLLVQ